MGFRKIDHFSWLKFIDVLETVAPVEKEDDKELLRQKRLAYYSGGVGL